MPVTNYPNLGDDLKVSLRNSTYRQFDHDFALKLKREYPAVWSKGGNIRGNEAFSYWTKAREGNMTRGTIDWIREREGWAARHYRNKRLPGVVAAIKWGVVLDIGEGAMKRVVREEMSKVDSESVVNEAVSNSLGSWRGQMVAYAQEAVSEYPEATGSPFGTFAHAEFSEQPWDGSSVRFTTPEFCMASAYVAPGKTRETVDKQDCKLPHHEPDGTVNVNAVRNALARLNQTDITQEERDTAELHLRNALDRYNETKEGR